MRLANAVEMAARRVDDAAGFQDRYGVPRTVINELLNGAQKDFDELTREAPATPMLALQRARLHRLFAQLYEVAGDTAQQNAMAARALEALARLPTTRRIEAPRTWFVQLPAANDVQIERLLALDVLGQASCRRRPAGRGRHFRDGPRSRRTGRRLGARRGAQPGSERVHTSPGSPTNQATSRKHCMSCARPQLFCLRMLGIRKSLSSWRRFSRTRRRCFSSWGDMRKLSHVSKGR
jgi:hypothetical protein